MGHTRISARRDQSKIVTSQLYVGKSVQIKTTYELMV